MKTTPQRRKASFHWGHISLLRVVKHLSLILGAVILICVLTFVFFPDPFINTFIKPCLTKAFTEAFPAYSMHLGDMHYSVWKNRLGCDSIILKSTDSTFTSTVGSFSVSGIGWIKLLLRRDVTPNTLAGSVIDAQTIALTFRQSQIELRCTMLHISVPDSEVVADSLKYYSLIDDERFFGKSRFRQTRFRFDVPHMTMRGLDCLKVLRGNIYKARSITLHDVFADILVNMDKPYDEASSKPQMPNEALSSIREFVNLDSLKVIRGRLKYCERKAVNAEPGVISFTKVNITATGIGNHTAHPDTARIHAEGLFMNSGTMDLFLVVPLTSTDYSLRCSGSLSEMDATELNDFIEPCEHRRIETGAIQSATFQINVNSGNATGTLRVEYEDLEIAFLNKKTGSEEGLFDEIAELVGKVFVIRRTNMPDRKGMMKIGVIKYARNPDDYFVQYLWFALRSGVKDVVGF